MHILSPVTDNCPSWKSGRRNESMLPDRVSNPGPLTYESGALPIALRGPASEEIFTWHCYSERIWWSYPSHVSNFSKFLGNKYLACHTAHTTITIRRIHTLLKKSQISCVGWLFSSNGASATIIFSCAHRVMKSAFWKKKKKIFTIWMKYEW